jgi:hypothetical protein
MVTPEFDAGSRLCHTSRLGLEIGLEAAALVARTGPAEDEEAEELPLAPVLKAALLGGGFCSAPQEPDTTEEETTPRQPPPCMPWMAGAAQEAEEDDFDKEDAYDGLPRGLLAMVPRKAPGDQGGIDLGATWQGPRRSRARCRPMPCLSASHDAALLRSH